MERAIEGFEDGRGKGIEASGLFFAIGHEPNVKFLSNQLETDEQVRLFNRDVVNNMIVYTNNIIVSI